MSKTDDIKAAFDEYGDVASTIYEKEDFDQTWKASADVYTF